MLYREQTLAPRAFHSELQQQTNTVNTRLHSSTHRKARLEPAIKGCAERFSALKVRMGCGLHPSLPRSRFCLVTQRSSGGALRDETKTAARETSPTLTLCLYTIINSIVAQHLGCFIGQFCRLWVVSDAQEWDIIVRLVNDKIRDLTRPLFENRRPLCGKKFQEAES